jgi:hypothetical protein
MIPSRESGATTPNSDIRPLPARRREGNVAWLARSGLSEGVVLLGGTSLLDFRVRVAQSQLRGDITPSYWSLCGLLSLDGTLRTVPLQPADVSAVPSTNGVRAMSLSDFDDPAAWPNVAVVRFAANTGSVLDQARKVERRRSVIDLTELLIAWLGYGWAAGTAENPLLHSKGVPSAAYVETAHALAGIELTPGLSSASSCPEAMWQAAKWWRDYYEGAAQLAIGGDAGPVVPQGAFAVRQPSAAIALPPEALASLRGRKRS